MVVGSGGREHALAWRIARCPDVEEVLVAPGNGGTEQGNIRNVAAGTHSELAQLALREHVDFTVVGPEQPLADGLADLFGSGGLEVLGPTAAVLKLEASKLYAKRIMNELGIPTARAEKVTDLGEARKFLRRRDPPYVIKADGLAGGKGVVIAETLDEADQAVAKMLAGRFGEASRTVLIEDHLSGTEMSFIALCDGRSAVALGTSQDHKRLGEADAGPNTGGMGAVSPSPLDGVAVDPEKVMRTVIDPVVLAMAMRGCPYRGFLYAGLMVSDKGEINVLEFNCRLGDPEAQVLLPLWEGDVTACMQAAARGRLVPEAVQWSGDAAVGVVLAAPGYPDRPVTGGKVIISARLPPAVVAFHAGTRRAPDGGLAVCGGRVLCVTAVAHSMRQAGRKAYRGIALVSLENGQFRGDIGANCTA